MRWTKEKAHRIAVMVLMDLHDRLGVDVDDMEEESDSEMVDAWAEIIHVEVKDYIENMIQEYYI